MFVEICLFLTFILYVYFISKMQFERGTMTTKKEKVPRFYMCSCFTTHNIFLHKYNLHVRFESEDQFQLDYKALLISLGCVTDQQFKEVLDEISQEKNRRRQLGATSIQRISLIKQIYKPLHPHVYHLQEAFLSPKLLQIVEYCQSNLANDEGLLELLEQEEALRVYRFPVFEKSFCQALLEELEHFERSSAPKGRPNTMNKYGVILDEMGFEEGFITPLREQYLRPITSLLFPDCGGRCLDSHKAFVVKYDMNGDQALSFHFDNAEVTLNVCLGKEFTEGNLYFGDMRQVPLKDSECIEIEHKVSEGILHRGQHMHGALPISQGQRWNLIIWMRSSQERNKMCPMCNSKPTLVDGEGISDGFTKDLDAAT